MRAAFLQALLEEARRDARIILVDPDSIGFHCEAHRRELPDQYLNMGIAEQNAVGVSAGLALTGQRPFLFNILAFNSFRCFEQVRLDVCAMHLSVVLVGIAATGPMVRRAEEVAEALSARSVDAGVVDVFRLKPFPEQRFVDLAKSFSRIATLEEHFISGGLGSAVLEAMADYGLPGNVRRFGLPDRFCRVCGDRDYLHRECGLDAATLVAQFGGWLRTPRGFGVS
jgi:transketolase C-terminal domain/subunit